MVNELNVRGLACHVFQEDIRRSHPLYRFEMKFFDQLTFFLSFSYDQSRKICVCGYPNSEHRYDTQDSNSKWSIEHNTLEEINPEYGLTREESSVRK